MPRNSELTLNSQLATVLRTLNPAWEALSAERTQVLRAAAGQQPDLQPHCRVYCSASNHD